MGVTTVSSAIHIAPVVLSTFLKHGKLRAQKFKEGEADTEPQDDILFDEAFNIVKAFIAFGTRNTVESLQAFTNTHVPAPYWAAVSTILIPLDICNRAADTLIDWFGAYELKRVVGGERWWQVRGLNGIDGEWITEKEYLSDGPLPDLGRKLDDNEKNILRMEHLDTIMLYIHGGGFFWGSIKIPIVTKLSARQIHGRAFAVNYRKAPQYPWPCPLQDVIAAYLYLIDPPPHAIHKPVPPNKIVFAGDSAGGNLALSTLIVLRDMGLPMPAGAILISPWVDLTHSFDSIMSNTKTDIIPEYGFLAKPSTSWPVHAMPPDGGRVVRAKHNPPPPPGRADTLKPSGERMKSDNLEKKASLTRIIMSQEDMLRSIQQTPEGSRTNTNKPTDHDEVDELWEPRPPKVLMNDPSAVPLELRSQIQLYATTEQLSHPLVSPILQSSLGNLPPLYIIAGDGEVLRDEIIYLAHRAAHPADYPTRNGVLQDYVRQKGNAVEFTKPTKVHLQVFDGMCHVLTVFIFTEAAKYAYRTISDFAVHVTDLNPQQLTHRPFPELQQSTSGVYLREHPVRKPKRRFASWLKSKKSSSKFFSKTGASDRHHEKGVEEEFTNNATVSEQTPQIEVADTSSSVDTSTSNLRKVSLSESGILDYASTEIVMLRQRVDIFGQVRTMEPQEEMPMLQIPPSQVGIIREAPTLRWLKGQEIWDSDFKRTAKKVIRKRKKIERQAEILIANAKKQGILTSDSELTLENSHARNVSVVTSVSNESVDNTIQLDRRWGPLDLDDETPPASAIAKRRDTPEALALLKKSIYHTAPVTHKAVPKLKRMDAVRAAFDPNDDPMHAPKQSVSEQQVRTHVIPMHGVKMWDGLIRYFMHESSKRAVGKTKHALGAYEVKTTQ